MTKTRFWKIIAASRRRFDPQRREGNMDLQCEDLARELVALRPAEIVEWDKHFTARMDEAFRWDLWAVAYIIGQGCSDDWFDYFCRWLISMDREVFEEALRDPDSLAEPAFSPGVEDVFFEDFGWGQAWDAYEKLTGGELPRSEQQRPLVPAGTPFTDNEVELRRKYPRVWAASRARRR